MSSFVPLDDGGYVNLDHVAEIKEFPSGVCFVSPDGKIIGKARRGFDSSIHIGCVVPAQPGLFIVWFGIDDGKYWCARDEQIVAFRVTPEGAVPISLQIQVTGWGEFTSGWGVLFPDGKVQLPGEQIADSLEDLERLILRRAELEEKHKAIASPK